MLCNKIFKLYLNCGAYAANYYNKCHSKKVIFIANIKNKVKWSTKQVICSTQEAFVYNDNIISCGKISITLA